ncbi:MAG TPA: MBL fold metallo-hydrolase [Terriglobia bacterium]|nr:MBL fold metallo-hydrolase [Terriglobia bacterium]
MKIAERVHLIGSGSLGTGMTHPADCNVYAVNCGGEHVLVDSGVGQETGQLVANLTSDGIEVESVRKLFLTHAHLDHSGGAGFLREALGLQVCASAASTRALETGDETAISLDVAKQAGLYPPGFEFRSCCVDRILSGDECFRVADCEITVLSTPGHSRDMLGYLFRTPREMLVFSGDTVFFGGKILLSAVYDCSVQDYVSSLKKLAELQVDALFPGHGLWAVKEGSTHLRAAAKPLDRLLLPPNLL